MIPCQIQDPIDYTSATTLPSGATFTYINLNPSMDK